MISGSEARNTDLSITAHVRNLYSGLVQKDREFGFILEEVLLGRGQGNLKLKPKQKEALQAIVLNDQDCLIVLRTDYGESLIH